MSFTKAEVRAQLVAMGYSDVPELVVEQFVARLTSRAEELRGTRGGVEADDATKDESDEDDGRLMLSQLHNEEERQEKDEEEPLDCSTFEKENEQPNHQQSHRQSSSRALQHSTLALHPPPAAHSKAPSFALPPPHKLRTTKPTSSPCPSATRSLRSSSPLPHPRPTHSQCPPLPLHPHAPSSSSPRPTSYDPIDSEADDVDQLLLIQRGLTRVLQERGIVSPFKPHPPTLDQRSLAHLRSPQRLLSSRSFSPASSTSSVSRPSSALSHSSLSSTSSTSSSLRGWVSGTALAAREEERRRGERRGYGTGGFRKTDVVNRYAHYAAEWEQSRFLQSQRRTGGR